MGRRTKRTPKLINKLLVGLENGEYENSLCAQLSVHPTNVRIWKRNDPELRGQVNEARRDGILARLEADKLTLEQAESRDDILRAKECLAHSRWEAEKLLKDFQPIQKSEVQHSGPMIIGWENEIQPKPLPPLSDNELNLITPEDIAN